MRHTVWPRLCRADSSVVDASAPVASGQGECLNLVCTSSHRLHHRLKTLHGPMMFLHVTMASFCLI